MVLLLASVMLAVRPPPDGHNLRAVAHRTLSTSAHRHQRPLDVMYLGQVMTGVMLHAFRSVAVTSVAKLGYGR